MNTTRAALESITAAVEKLFASGWLEDGPTNTEQRNAYAELTEAMADAHRALAVTEPLMLSHDELRGGDMLAFHTGRFDTIGTMDDLHRTPAQAVDWITAYPTANGVLSFLSAELRRDRTYVVKRPL